MTRLSARLLPTLLAAYGAAVLGVTLYPFRFQLDHASVTGFAVSQVLTWRDTGFWEPLGNVLLFVPLGLLLAAWRSWPEAASWRRAGLVVAICTAGSISIEGLQVLLPERTPSLKDVVLNGVGGGLGVLLYQLSWALLAPQVRPRRLARWLVGTYGGILLATTTLGAVPWAWGLSSWNPAYPLVLGAETTGGRSWHGTVSDLMVSGCALSDRAFDRLLDPSFPNAVDAAWYPLQCDSLCANRTGRLPPLVRWTHGKPVAPPVEGVRLRRRQGFRTEAPVDTLLAAMRTGSQFTVALTVTSEADLHRGPAPLLSLAPDPGHRNLLLGQEWQALHLLLRTPATGPRADRVVLVVPNFFERDVTRRLALRYDGGTFTLATHDAPVPYRLRITPEVALLWWTAYAFGPYRVTLGTDEHPSRIVRWTTRLYYLLVFIPLGLLLAACVRSHPEHRTRWMLAGLVLLPGLLQGVLLLAGGVLSVANVGLSLGTLGAALGLGLLIVHVGDWWRTALGQ